MKAPSRHRNRLQASYWFLLISPLLFMGEEKDEQRAESLLRILHPLSLRLDLWEAQNIYFSVGKQLLAEMEEKAEKGDDQAKAWMTGFQDLGDYLEVRTV